MTGDNHTEVKSMLLRLVDYLKMKRITAFFTSLNAADEHIETTDVYISSLIDTWLLLRDIESAGERNRALYVLKSRGMAHSNQIREFKLTNKGIELLDVYVGQEGVLTGSARVSQEMKDAALQVAFQQEIRRKQIELERKRAAMEDRISLLQSEFQAEESEALKLIAIEDAGNKRSTLDKARMVKSRRGGGTTPSPR
jgi:circadian clock protein KaiC